MGLGIRHDGARVGVRPYANAPTLYPHLLTSPPTHLPTYSSTHQKLTYSPTHATQQQAHFMHRDGKHAPRLPQRPHHFRPSRGPAPTRIWRSRVPGLPIGSGTARRNRRIHSDRVES